MEGGFGFTCAHCGAANLLAPVAIPEVEAVPDTAPESTAPKCPKPKCPKCGLRRADGPSCVRCGLSFELHAAGKTSIVDPLGDVADSDTWRARWADLEHRTHDTAAHRTFIDACAAAGLLEFAGACYRALSDAQPVEDEQVASYRARILQIAMAHHGGLEPAFRDDSSARLRLLIGLTVAATILAILAGGYYYMSRYQAYY